MQQETKGYVHLYVGDGKGKTTAAVGLAVRALGQGKRVLFCQFLKGRETGEVGPLRQLGAQVLRAKHGAKFTFQMSPQELEEARAQHRLCLSEAAGLIRAGGLDLVVLDEVVDAVNARLIAPEELSSLIQSRPPHLEVVLSGRNPHPDIVVLSDYHTEFVCRAHPYQKGVAAREGVEF